MPLYLCGILVGMSDVTRLLSQIERRDPSAAENRNPFDSMQS
jgi:hypothetical protein